MQYSKEEGQRKEPKAFKTGREALDYYKLQQHVITEFEKEPKTYKQHKRKAARPPSTTATLNKKKNHKKKNNQKTTSYREQHYYQQQQQRMMEQQYQETSPPPQQQPYGHEMPYMLSHVHDLQNELRISHTHMEQMGMALNNLKEDNIQMHRQMIEDQKKMAKLQQQQQASAGEELQRKEQLYQDEKKKNSLLLEKVHQLNQKIKDMEFQKTIMEEASPYKTPTRKKQPNYIIDHKPETPPPQKTPQKANGKRKRSSTFPCVDVLLRDFDESNKPMLQLLTDLQPYVHEQDEALRLTNNVFLTTQRVIKSYIDTSNRQVYAIIESTHKQPSVTSPFGSDEFSPMKVASAMVSSMQDKHNLLPFYFTYMMNKYRKENYLKLIDTPFLVDHIIHDIFEDIIPQTDPNMVKHVRTFVTEIVPTLFCFQLCHIFMDETSCDGEAFDIDLHDRIRDGSTVAKTMRILTTVRPALIFSKDPAMSSPQKVPTSPPLEHKVILRKPLVKCYVRS